MVKSISWIRINNLTKKLIKEMCKKNACSSELIGKGTEPQQNKKHEILLFAPRINHSTLLLLYTHRKIYIITVKIANTLKIRTRIHLQTKCQIYSANTDEATDQISWSSIKDSQHFLFVDLFWLREVIYLNISLSILFVLCRLYSWLMRLLEN